ncbi:MAG: formate--tetrahydrofolate ligase, partial [Caldiserica bacterium]|nr:formate--tetrahydrofolate ligase [Caldisericota bacterium]
MNVKSDIEIAQSVKMMPIQKVAEKIGISPDFLELYGNFKAKLSYDLQEEIKDR